MESAVYFPCTAFMMAKGISGMFIGLNDEAKEGTWTWTDGRELSFTSWYPNQPDNWNNQQDCTRLDRKGGSNPLKGLWDDNKCFVNKPFACQMRPV